MESRASYRKKKRIIKGVKANRLFTVAAIGLVCTGTIGSKAVFAESGVNTIEHQTESGVKKDSNISNSDHNNKIILPKTGEESGLIASFSGIGALLTTVFVFLKRKYF